MKDDSDSWDPWKAYRDMEMGGKLSQDKTHKTLRM